jgi:hypothetical protein
MTKCLKFSKYGDKLKLRKKKIRGPKLLIFQNKEIKITQNKIGGLKLRIYEIKEPKMHLSPFQNCIC